MRVVGRRLEWDEVERELFIISERLVKLSSDFNALAVALHRESEFASKGRTNSGDAPGQTEKVGADRRLPFPPTGEEVFD